ncbi:MAG: ROK family glucokinase [Lachnospiraceae bacterium]|nr:ROK family glucokinase [Lachnospiraceae bacterium]MDD6618317.1 ROK family glucokinase [Clostridiales bacterium]MDY4769476.1 ROK family glucokinase [Lachnospiraceae bacterium]
MGKYCFGIDVGGTSIKCGFFTAEGELLEKWEIPTRTENQGENILPDIAKSIEKKMEEKAISKEQVTGVGIGVPGPVNKNGEIPTAVNLNWGYKHISKEMEELTGLPSKAGNDANVAALGEAWKGGAAGCANVILATLGTGVGGGIIVDGKIVAGAHGAGGEIGHANVKHDETDSCNCGNKGCLEQMASATGIVRLAKKALAASDQESALRAAGDKLSAKKVFDAYKAGDALAAEIVEEFGDYLGGALATFATVVDPDVILIGGGVSRAGQPLVDVVEKYYKKYAFTPCKETPIRLAELGNDAGIYGSAKLVVE